MELVLELVEKIIPTGRGTPLGVNLCFVGRAGYTGPSPRTISVPRVLKILPI